MREVFELSRKHYLSYKEIAEKLDMSEEAVSKQIKRALLHLRLRLCLFTCLLISCHYAIMSQKPASRGQQHYWGLCLLMVFLTFFR